MRRSAQLAVPILASSAIGAVAIFVLRAAGPADPEGVEGAVDYTRAFNALCEVADLAEDGDLQTANGVFLSRAHLTLHELAAEASDIDRSVAASLLEAKAEVESMLPLEDPDTPGAVDALVRETAAAIKTVTQETAPTCEEPDR